ncbi:MAG: three-Cys-motif partner protein TcmP [Nitrospinae bacterium]|nr:three-Cys-motif partner protein TcmP [Nitrospinota bacterium]
MTPPEKLEYLDDDELLTPEVGPWAEEKYKYVSYYNKLFSTSMKDRWDCRTYIDLFAGAGRSRIRRTNKILAGSPLLALGVPDQYDKYIICEKDEELMEALKSRIEKEYSHADVKYVLGDCNEMVDEICAAIPKPSPRRTVLSFCFIDPYNIDIHFETVRRLSDFFIDFLMVLALGMDAQRNESHYCRPDVTRVDYFLGDINWRDEWEQERRKKGVMFRTFLAKKYASQMETIGYTGTSLEKMKRITPSDRDLSLYYLAFFSRSDRGRKFWEQALRYVPDQPALPFE